MRPSLPSRGRGAGLLLGALVAVAALALPACDGRWWLGPLHAPADRSPAIATWTTLPATRVNVYEPGAAMRVLVRVDLPPATHVGTQRVLALRFAHPLDGAKVDADAWAPTQRQALVAGRRVAGNVVEIPLGALDVSGVEVTIHRHLRQPPVLLETRVGETAPPHPEPPRPGPPVSHV